MTDLRSLLAEMADELDYCRKVLSGDRRDTHALAREARAALAAAPEGEPSDQELRDLWSWSSAQDQGPWPTQYHCFARAVLARWGSPNQEQIGSLLGAAATPPAPLEGEVSELVAKLRRLSPLSILAIAAEMEGADG